MRAGTAKAPWQVTMLTLGRQRQKINLAPKRCRSRALATILTHLGTGDYRSRAHNAGFTVMLTKTVDNRTKTRARNSSRVFPMRTKGGFVSSSNASTVRRGLRAARAGNMNEGEGKGNEQV